jgi:hypothetical protein
VPALAWWLLCLACTSTATLPDNLQGSWPRLSLTVWGRIFEEEWLSVGVMGVSLGACLNRVPGVSGGH